MFDAVPSLLPLIQAGKLRPLAAASAKRNPIVPSRVAVDVAHLPTTPAGGQSPPPPTSSAPHQVTCILIICW